MKKLWIPAALIFLLILSGCAKESEVQEAEPRLVTAQEGKAMLDGGEAVILLDVRSPEEFESGHIENAILIPDDEIEARAETELPDKNAPILLYCRSGRRSAAAAKKLAEMGYTHIYDMGGILDWPYETVG